MPVAKNAEVSFLSADRVGDVIHTFNADGFDSLCPTVSGAATRVVCRCGGDDQGRYGVPFTGEGPVPSS
jgi:hypothetical protein